MRDSVELYNEISSESPSPYSAYLNYGTKLLVIHRIIFKENLSVQTKPIKGTIKRGKNITDDLKQKSKLLKSKKIQLNLL